MIQQVRETYGARVGEYVEVCGTMDAADPHDRRLVADWASRTPGPILDVGCGPGQWTAYLHERGASIAGVDPVAEFVQAARRAYPGVEYRVGRAGALDCAPASLGGALAWFSLIHTPPEEFDAVLADLASAVRSGGRLLVGYFEGPRLEAFDHKVCTAWYWPEAELVARLAQAGFACEATEARTDPGARRVGAVSARRRDAAGDVAP
ncbi:MAG: class I SAM-dependent methyltransferase [Gordonia sp. (in: high G+C Gram-positive bacteria)]